MSILPGIAPARAGAGFTLIEMAVAVFVIALLLGSILVPLTTQVEQRQVTDVQKTLEEIKDAITGFALTNGYLPCPDKSAAAGAGVANDGFEDVAIGTCVAMEGNVPWATLGTAGSDAWGNRFRYRVQATFAQRSPVATFTLGTTSMLEICTASACGAGTRLTIVADGPPAIILSHGRNGYLAINANTGVANACPAGGCSADETANGDGNTIFVYRAQSAGDSPAGEFDDIVSWISKNALFNRMVAAGKLP